MPWPLKMGMEEKRRCGKKEKIRRDGKENLIPRKRKAAV
jgi:hypothetical protein